VRLAGPGAKMPPRVPPTISPGDRLHNSLRRTPTHPALPQQASDAELPPGGRLGQDRLDRAPKSMRIRRATVEHPFGTLKAWMGATHFRTKTLAKVRTEMSPHVLAYNLKRVIASEERDAGARQRRYAPPLKKSSF
jgi:hypothetical protein